MKKKDQKAYKKPDERGIVPPDKSGTYSPLAKYQTKIPVKTAAKKDV